jgi:hypothetical protein
MRRGGSSNRFLEAHAIKAVMEPPANVPRHEFMLPDREPQIHERTSAPLSGDASI